MAKYLHSCPANPVFSGNRIWTPLYYNFSCRVEWFKTGVYDFSVGFYSLINTIILLFVRLTLLSSSHYNGIIVSTLASLTVHWRHCQYTGIIVSTLASLSVHWHHCQYTGIAVLAARLITIVKENLTVPSVSPLIFTFTWLRGLIIFSNTFYNTACSQAYL